MRSGDVAAMPKIFISYNHVDRSFTEDLAEQLRRVYGYNNVWFDREILGGEVWWNEILDTIAQSDIFIYLLSPASLKSNYCLAVFQEAQRLQKRIIPILIRPVTVISESISRLNPIDMLAGITEENFTAFRTAIARHEQAITPTPP